MHRSEERARRAAYLYAAALITVLYLFLPYGGYERMMEGKWHCFLLLAVPGTLALAALAPCAAPRREILRACAAVYLLATALSALASPYGAVTLLGGTRRDGLLSIALYVAAFFLFARFLRPDRLLLRLSAAAAALSAVLALAQIAGGNPLGLYPADLGYADGDIAYAGFFAGTSGNVDFTAFLLALAVAVLTAALIRGRTWELAPAIVLALLALWRLGVAAAWVGLAAAAVWSPALLFPRHRGRMLLLSAALTAAGAAILYGWPSPDGTLGELSRAMHGELDGSFGSGRVAIWRSCLPLVRERLLLGGGPDTLALRGVPPMNWIVDGELELVDITAAHNEYLNILVNQGALALAAYLALLGAALARCFRHAAETRFAVCGAGLLAYAAMAMFSISTPITAPYVWLLLALAAGA